MSKIKLPRSSGNSMSITAPATNPASDLELKLPATIGTANQVLRNSSTPGTLEFGGPLAFFVKLDSKQTAPTESEIDAEVTRLNKVYDDEKYKRDRAAEYPSIADQLDDIYHNGIDAWKATIKTTKDKYPKP